MAEQELQNASIDEPLATPEQQESAPKVTRRGKRQNAENGTRKRSSTRKMTPGAVEAPATNGASGAHGTASQKARSKKQPRPADAPVSANGDVATDTSPPPPLKRRPSRKSASTTKRGATTSLKKQPEAPPPQVQEAVTAAEPPALPTGIPPHIDADAREAAPDVAPFEPDLNPTPVKDREMRSLASLEAELDALLSELALEAPPSELEDTMERPALRPPYRVGEALQSTDIPETPSLAAGALADIPETPLSSSSELDAVKELSIPVEDETVWETVVVAEEVEAATISAGEAGPAAATVWQWPELETTPAAIEMEQPAPLPSWPLLRRRPVKRAAMLLALFLFITASLLLWQDVNETHLYLYDIDPANGQTLAQQDLGGYQGISSLSNPAQDQLALLLGVSPTSSGQQQILTLAGSDTSWHVTRQFSAPGGRSTLSIAPGRLLAVEDAGGLQVMTSDGRALWQASGDAPALGAHPFAPALDSSTVYTIKSARQGIVAAYNAQNGSLRWSAQVDDTLNYAPPLLLMGDTLYVAGDHTLYALNTTSGGIHWKAAGAARTLLFNQAQQPALIAAGASGLTAFDAQNGNVLWSFKGQPGASAPNANGNGSGDALTAAQFYQAGFLTTSSTVYATGITWDTRQAQQQLWLFAVDANTGKQDWSERLGTGFTNADGGRVFAPFIDAPHRLVMIEQAQADGSHTLSAFDTADGFLRWSIRLAAVSASAPDLTEAASANLGIFSAQTDAATALRAGSWLRLLLLALAAASLLSLILLWILPLRDWLGKTNRRLRRLPHYLIAPLRGLKRLWRFSRLLFALTLVAAFICASILTYTQLNQQQPYVKQVGASDGKALWQRAESSPATLTGVDTQGELLVTGAGDHSYQLSALDSLGSPRWTIPSGQATFSFPQLATQAGTVLAVLNGPTTHDYRYAPDDPAYQNPLAHYLALYLLDSNTGRVLWQNDLFSAGALQDSLVLGADSQFIYIASRSLQNNMVAQLIAVDKMSGITAWRVYGPREQANVGADYGALLRQGRFLYWQVQNAVYALNPQTGQIAWRDAIAEVDANVSALEEGQMATGDGILLIRRSDMYHALDLVTGAERWTLIGLGVDDPRTPGGIIAAGSKFILYGNGSIEAFDTATLSILWKHIDLLAVSDVSLSQDGSLVYAVVFNNVDGGRNEQALVAFDIDSNLVHWTFQPGAQAQLVYAGSRIIYNARGMIYVTACLPGSLGNCARQVLYGIDGQTGAARWNIGAGQISNAQLSPDENTITFQTNSSAWENLKAIFKG